MAGRRKVETVSAFLKNAPTLERVSCKNQDLFDASDACFDQSQKMSIYVLDRVAIKKEENSLKIQQFVNASGSYNDYAVIFNAVEEQLRRIAPVVGKTWGKFTRNEHFPRKRGKGREKEFSRDARGRRVSTVRIGERESAKLTIALVRVRVSRILLWQKGEVKVEHWRIVRCYCVRTLIPEIYAIKVGMNTFEGVAVAALMAGATAVEGLPENNSVLYLGESPPSPRPPNYRETPTYYFALRA
ncbi:hypothetical protein WN51_12183 [Melipona quadrifasciata]|uniref:Uncharacterized protein n=1 Tax=Melipona quadrifasciata TaxID=166423 RepID=A0A0M9A426_9HYME|nr:hypothetical protein WN51_12183 [Melipona quadrifasciata]